MNKVIYLITLFLLLLAAGCKDDNEAEDGLGPQIDPSERILGKWQEISYGNSYYPEIPSEYGRPYYTIEFLPDGTYYGPYGLYHSIIDGEATHYRLESDSLTLYREGLSPYIYRYIFTGNDRFLASAVYGFTGYTMLSPTFHIFERIK